MNLFVKIAFRRRFLLISSDGLFTFSVPENLREKIEVGQMVLAPIKEETERGVVVGITEKEPDFSTREILEIVTPPLLSAESLVLATTIAREYFCPIAKVIPFFLPERIFLGNGISPREIWIQGIGNLEKKMGKKMSEALDFLKEKREILRQDFPFSSAIFNRLLALGAVVCVEREKKPILPKKTEILLSEEQEKICEKILDFPVSLLFGATGSGKSHLLCAVVQKVMEQGKTAVILVPEIGLTAEVLEKFSEIFGAESVGIFHSRLSGGEKARAFWAAQNQEKRIFVVSRAGLFLPFQNLGCLVVEEEHETAFENETTPKYDARRVAEILGALHSAPVIFSSATPRIETFFAAQHQKMGFFELSPRLSLPSIRLVDFRQEFAAKNKSPLSCALFSAIQKTITQKQKVFLFLNKRGLYRIILCQDCGEILRNPKNGVALVAHEKNGKIFLLCHHSGKIFQMPDRCPHCGGVRLVSSGYGTAGIEELLQKYFPQEKIIRIDRDVTQKKGSFSALKKEFSEGDARILVGTQIVAKGLDFENIGLVGILDADTGLHTPDFRATERAFQHLVQVAGRAGRRGQQAEVILQTRIPEYPLFSFLMRNDFRGFYDFELALREKFFLPPFSKMTTFSFRGKNREKVFERARLEEKKWRDTLERKYPHEKWEVSVAPALIPRRGQVVEVELRIVRQRKN